MLKEFIHGTERENGPVSLLFASLRERIKGMGEYYAGDLYPLKPFPFFWLLKRLLKRVTIAEEDVATLKDLSSKGVVVYSLKNKSQLNCLIIGDLLERHGIERPRHAHGINMILWQPFGKALRTIISRMVNNPYEKEYLKRITLDGASSVIYARGSAHVGSEYKKDPFLQLIDAQVQGGKPVFLVPQLVVYGRRRERQHRSFSEILFGPSDNPGPLRRVVLFLRYSKKAAVICCEPIDLSKFLDDNRDKPPGIQSNMLRGEIISRVNAERRSILGPVLKSREEIVGLVLRDMELVRAMKELAREEGRNYQDVVREASRYLHEIAADYRDSYIAFLDRVLTWVWNNIYDGIVVDREGLARIREISKKMPFVVVPCHRSHIDYLLIHYIFYYNNIQLPFIAAGNNLMIWPLGHIFRRAGAFFLRRTFTGNKLYGMVFEKYIKVLIQEGHPIEFFIEGGRSRTGKMVMPKYGLLSMVIQAYREGACDDIAIIPVYIGYDRVIEEQSYIKELVGETKSKESTKDLVKTSHILRKRYGRVYLNIGEPIQVKEYLARVVPSIEDRSTGQRQSLYRKMGYEIALRINKVSVVTPFALVAAALLSHYRRGIAHGDLMNIIDEFMDYLERTGISFSSTFLRKERAVNEALSIFESSGYLTKMGFDEEEEEDEEFSEIIYSVEDEHRLSLEYYKNTILHFFIPISFVSASILSSDADSITLSQVIDDYRFLRTLFWHEFIFDDEKDDMNEIRETLNYLANRGMVVHHAGAGDEDRIEATGRGRVSLVPFPGLIQNYIESYWVVLRGTSYLKTHPRGERDLLKRSHKLGIKMYNKGEISRAEALSQANYRGALRFLQDMGVIESVESGGERERKKDGAILSLADDKSKIDALRQRLFKFVANR